MKRKKSCVGLEKEEEDVWYIYSEEFAFVPLYFIYLLLLLSLLGWNTYFLKIKRRKKIRIKILFIFPNLIAIIIIILPWKNNDYCTPSVQQSYNTPSQGVGPTVYGTHPLWRGVVRLLYTWCTTITPPRGKLLFDKGLDYYTTRPQQLHNTLSHGGGPHTLGLTLMWGGVV